jgi:antitoxin component HigA of HigAB toxin-antitoxin module
MNSEERTVFLKFLIKKLPVEMIRKLSTRLNLSASLLIKDYQIG